MQNLTNYGNLAYEKTEELENKLQTTIHKVKQLEILYGTTPPPDDPNDTEDETYTPPPAGEVVTSGDVAVVPVYYESTGTESFPNLYFTADINSTLILKLNLQMVILSDPCSLTVDVYVDDELYDTYYLNNPVTANYQIPFANSYISEQKGHKINYKITPEINYSMTYKVITATYEILGSNVDILNPPCKHSVYYNNGLYYITKTEQGTSNYLMQSITGVNLLAEYTAHMQNTIDQKFCKATERIDYIWQSTNLGYLHKEGNGRAYLTNFNDPTKSISASGSNNFDFAPNQSTYYGGVLVYTDSSGTLRYNDVKPDFSSRSTRTIESGVDFYVNSAVVEKIHDTFNTYPQKAKIIGTRLNGTNVFFSAVRNFYKLELGYGKNVKAYYKNEEGTIINVYMNAYNTIVKKVLTYNASTYKYELTEQTAIGTWNKYILGAPPAYFTITNNKLTYNEQ